MTTHAEWVETIKARRAAMDGALTIPVRWSELAPSDYAFLAAWPPYGIPDKRMQTRAALLGAIQTMIDSCAIRCKIEETRYFFDFFTSRTAWISKGDSQESWPDGSIESTLLESLRKTGSQPQTVLNLVAEWIGDDRPDPWGSIGDQIADRLVDLGIVERKRDKQWFLFFNWSKTTYMLTEEMRDALDRHAIEAGESEPNAPFADRSLRSRNQDDAISKEINRAFDYRTEDCGD